MDEDDTSRTPLKCDGHNLPGVRAGFGDRAFVHADTAERFELAVQQENVEDLMFEIAQVGTE